MMTILSHRGFWTDTSYRNTETSFTRSWAQGFGLETDVRDLAGTLVISHDPPLRTAMTLCQFLELYEIHGKGSMLALNIKADGLQPLLSEILQRYTVTNYFVFDMSVPDTLPYLRNGLRVYTRHSEHEPYPAFLSQAQGVWLDMFLSAWPTEDEIGQYLDRKLAVCIVSPELHGRDPGRFWEWLKRAGLHRREGLALCTDLPATAREFFHERD